MKQGEAERIYQAIFKKKIPESVKERFYKTSPKLEISVSPNELENYKKLMERSGDIEAAEYASRIFGTNLLLRKKFQLMIYLAECIPENNHFFINEKQSLFRAFYLLASIPFHSMYKLIVGTIILKIGNK